MHSLNRSSAFRTTLIRVGIGLLTVTALGLPAARAGQSTDTRISLKLDPNGAPNGLPYYPTILPLQKEKPAGVLKEPTYTGKVAYGTIHLGNGPQADTYFAVDMPETGDYKIYVDANHNGDLTDDGDGKWSTKREGQRAMYGVTPFVLRASYGTKTKETSSAQYGVALYQFVGQDRVIMYRKAASVGEMTVAGAKHKVYLVENDADGLFSKAIDDEGKPIAATGATQRPVWLLIDRKDDGKFGRDAMIDVRGPFKLEDKTYEAKIADNGTKITLTPTNRPVFVPKQQERPALLAAGTAAPEFTCTGLDGRSIHLADYKGKVLILDFWATWCGPCQASMPHIEKVYHAVKDKNVAVLGLCVWDGKEEYDKWIPAHKTDYTFQFAFDPAGKDTPKSIAANLFKVSGIPTTYIIDKDGKVLDAIVGYGGASDKRVEAALKKAGIDVPVESASASN